MVVLFSLAGRRWAALLSNDPSKSSRTDIYYGITDSSVGIYLWTCAAHCRWNENHHWRLGESTSLIVTVLAICTRLRAWELSVCVDMVLDPRLFG
jgi:hypothetical protein